MNRGAVQPVNTIVRAVRILMIYKPIAKGRNILKPICRRIALLIHDPVSICGTFHTVRHRTHIHILIRKAAGSVQIRLIPGFRKTGGCH
ncbi:hypothetical protein D3C80_1463930 [compost metagenome]